MHGKLLKRSVDSTRPNTRSVMRTFRDNYGVIHVLQSSLIACNVLTCTASISGGGAYEPSIRNGNSKSLGEMKLTQLKSSGFKHVLQELTDRSGMCIIAMCSRCTCIHMLCERPPGNESHTFECKLPMKTVEFVIMARVGLDCTFKVCPEFS